MISQREIALQQREWAKQKKILQRQQKIKQEKREIKHPHRLKLTTSKLLAFLLFLNCTCIEIFSCWAIKRSIEVAVIDSMAIDFSPLVALITAVVGEGIGYWVYAAKSKAENTQGGIVYEMAMKQADNFNPEPQIDKTQEA